MKKLLLLAALAAFMTGPALAQLGDQFSATSPSGHTLYYRVIDAENHYVELINPNNTDGIWGEAWENYATPYGNVVVPQTVTNQDTVWTVKRIGRSAFASCPTVKCVTLPDGIDSIKAYAFFGTEVDSVNIPGSVTYIGSSNFHNPQLHYIHLPASLFYIDPWELDGENIQAFSVEEGNPYYRSIDGSLVREENGVVDLIAYPRGRVNGVVEIPEGVTRADWTPMGINASKLIVPSTMTYICPFGWEMQIYDTIVLHGTSPSHLAGSLYWTSRIELPCGSQSRYSATSWGQYASLFVTSDYLPQMDYTHTINFGDGYSWAGATLTERGVYEDTLQSVVEGCDSVHRMLTLNVVQTYRSDVLLTDDMSVEFHGLEINRPGVYDVLVPGEGDFDSLFVLRASAVVNATVVTVTLGGLFEGESIELPAMQSQIFIRGEDTITITNIHQLLYDTVDITIAEGDSYRGYALAGIYQDTILGADADSIIRSRVSMNINRPLDNCEVQLGGNITGNWYIDGTFIAHNDNIALPVIPSESRQVVFYPGIYGTNFVVNGDFEQDNTYPYVGDYATDDGDGYGSRTYGIQEGNGVDGSRCMWFGGSSLPNQALFRITIPSEIGSVYRFSYSAFATIYNMPYFSVRVNGQQIDNNDIVSQENQWFTFTHDFVATSSSTLVELVDLNTDWNGNDFLIDNISLIQVSLPVSDSISITNTHGLVYDTMNVTIAEGDSYRGYALAGVYQDTILGSTTDSIIHSRISMTVNRPLDNCMVQLGGNITGNWYIDGTFIAHNDNIALPVIPSESRQVVFYAGIYGTNCIEDGDFENSNIEAFITDYATPDSPGSAYRTYSHQEGVGVDGSYGVYFDGSTIADQSVISVTKATEPGCGYSFSYMARNTGNENPPYFQVKVNGVPQEGTDVIPLDGSVWTTSTHDFIATSATTTIDIVDLCLQGNGNDFYLDNISLVQTTTNHSDTITITNTHGLVYDTVDVAIAEGDTLLGHTLAGIYQDTIIGAETDSIVHSRVSMTVDRPMDSCLVQVDSSPGYKWITMGSRDVLDGTAVAVPPTTSVTLVRYQTGVTDGNLITNGDFDTLDTVNIHYPVMKFWPLPNDMFDWNNIGRGAYRTNERWGENCLEFMWATDTGTILTTTVDVEPNTLYEVSFYFVTSNDNEFNYEELYVDGEYIGGHSVREQHSQFFTSWDQLHPNSYFFNSGDRTQVTLSLKFNPVGCCYYTFIDKFIVRPIKDDDMITITNTHGLVRDTVDVTINEDGSYHGHTLAGVYQDTVIGSATDSIVYARVSMNINHTFGAGIATVGTNQEGRLWMGLDDGVLTTDPSFTTMVDPTKERRYVFTSLADGSNLQPNAGFEQDWSNCSSDYAGSDIPFQGSHYVTICDTCGRTGKGVAVKGSALSSATFYKSEFINVTEGHRYSFGYWAKSHSTNPAVVTVYVNAYADTHPPVHLDGTDTLDGGEWKRYEHVFTAQANYTAYVRLYDLNTSSVGNEFFLDDISFVDLTEAADARRDTVSVRNIHQLVYTTVDTTINEGDSYKGYTTAGVYNDTVVMADYDSIVRTRISYVLNARDEGVAMLGSNSEGVWIDLDDNTVYNSDSVSVKAMQTRRFARLVPAADTNLIVNGDFEQGNTGFTSHYLYRPEPYNLGDDETYYVGGYRISGFGQNHYFLAFNYYDSRNGAAYETTVGVQPDVWYALSYRGVSDFSGVVEGDVLVPRSVIGINGKRLAFDELAYDANVDIKAAKVFSHCFYSNGDSIVTIRLSSPSYADWTYYGWKYYENIYSYAFDDIVLVPLKVSDTITITNRHQVVYATVDTTISEGESYKDYTLAGVYVDTLLFTDYDSIVTSRVSMVINRLDGTLQLGTNRIGIWTEGPSVVVPPMQTRQFTQLPYPADHNLLPNGDFEQGNISFGSEYPYVDCHCFDYGHYSVVGGEGVDGSYCLLVDGGEHSDSAFYYQSVAVTPGLQYRFSYKAKARCGFYGSLGRVALLVDGVQLDGEDIISGDQNDCNAWNTFERTFTATSDTVLIKMVDLNTAVGDNDFYVDDIRLQYDVALPADTHTISVTNRHQLVYDTMRVDLCQGSQYEADGQGYGTTGTYTLNTQLYEDSTVYPTLVLTMHDNYYSQLSANICEDESYTFAGNALSTTGTYVDSLASVWGCDSLITLSLNVYSHTTSEQTEDVCDSYTWHGTTYTASSVAYDTIANINGCDSICTLNLTVRHSTAGDTAASECDHYQWYDQWLATSGDYQHTLTNAAGCDSVLTLSLEVRSSTAYSESMAVCDSVTWNGQYLDATGTYEALLTNGVGCDSTVTLTLTVNPTYQHTDAVFACDNHLPYVYHGTDLAEAGDHTVVLQSAAGCDSTLTVTLTVGATYRHDDAVAVCQSGMPYSYGVQTFQPDDPSGTYEVPFTTVEGCDSIIDLALTVHESENTEIYVVTVSGTHNVVVWDRKAVVEHYNVYRESSTSGSYSLMAEVPYDAVNMWIDSTSDSRARSYRYRISSTDSCGVESEQSELHRTMHLTISQGINGSWNLVWTEYEGTSYTTYRIYRGSSYSSLEMIDEIPSVNTTYTDYNAPAGDVYYQIVILMGPLNAKDVHPATINSNIATNAEVGVGTVAGEGMKVYVSQGTVVAEAPMGVRLKLFDAVGREVATCVSTGRDLFEVPASGTYMLQADGLGSRRVVVVK